MAGIISRIPIKNIAIYNDIYDLGIKDEDCQSIETLFNTLQGSKMVYYLAAGTSQRDLALRFTDSDPAISLMQTDEPAKRFGYKIFKLANGRYHLRNVPQKKDIPYLDTLGMIPNIDQQNFVFDDVADLKNFILTKDLPILLTKTRGFKIDDVELLYWAADLIHKFNKTQFTDTKRYEGMPDYVKHIIDVIQLADDTRIAIYYEKSMQQYSGAGYSLSLKTYVIKPDNSAYNWTDPGRYFSHVDKKTGYGKVYYVGPAPTFPPTKAIDLYARGHKLISIENETLELIDKRHRRKELEATAEKGAQKQLQTKLGNKLTSLDKDGEFSFNDVTFSKNTIEYEKQILKSDNIDVKDIVSKFLTNLGDEYFNFDHVHEEFCLALAEKAVKDGIVAADFGTTHAVIEAETKTNIAGAKVTTVKVNDIRINRDEVAQVLQRALCYTKTDDFNYFLETVNKCSLRYHKYIASGLELKIKDDIMGNTIEFKIAIEREKSRNFISFKDGTRYKVADTNRLLSLLNAQDMTRVINVLLDPAIVGVTGKDIKQILKSGQAALEEERTREQQLLSKAIKVCKVEEQEDAMMENGRVVSGYVVGGKLRTYIVDKGSLRVYEYPTGKYLCMVDKGQNEHTNVSRLVSRIFALSNDSKLSQEISTLQ